MTFIDESIWQGKVFSGGWRQASGGDAAVIEPAAAQPAWAATPPNTPFGGLFASGTGARFGGTANLDAFTDTRWVTVRGEIAPYPF